MKNCLIILENGFEDCEGITTIDILKRSRINVCTCSLYSKSITTQYGLNITVEKTIDEVSEKDFDCLIIPGGKAVINVLSKSEKLKELIKKFYHNSKLIACICAAPSLLCELDLLENTTYTCYKGFNSGSGIYKDLEVVVTPKIITAKSMYYTIPFALEVVRSLCGDKIRNETEELIHG